MSCFLVKIVNNLIELNKNVYICRKCEKSATYRLHFFVRYVIMYNSDAQMSFPKKHIKQKQTRKCA